MAALQAVAARSLEEALRGALMGTHAAAGLALVRSKEAARLLRISESSARAAAAVLGEAESVLRAAAQSASSSAVVTPATVSSTRSARRRARKKESKQTALAKMNLADDHDKGQSDGESNSGDSGVSSVDSSKEGAKEDRREQEQEAVTDTNSSSHDRVKSQSITSSPLLYQPREALKIPGLTLEEMLDEHFEEDFDEDDEVIPEEDIRSFLDKSEDMALKRQQLRENLKERFAMLCVKAKE